MLKTLLVKNFRNLAIPEVKFTGGSTIIIGSNGQGKTNLLEAMHCLSYGRSFRGSKKETINWYEREARVLGLTDRESIEIIFRREDESRILINNKQKRFSQLIGKFVSVLFHPEDMLILTGGPSLRRAWLDKLISTINKNYLFALVRYQKALLQKNKVLKNLDSLRDQLEIWNNHLSKHGSYLWKVRSETIEIANKILKVQSGRLAGKTIFLKYETPLAKIKDAARQKTYQRMLDAQLPSERRFQVTIFGPHRDDFKIFAEEIAGRQLLQKDLSRFGSRGEQRQALVLLKLTEGKIFGEFFKEPPSILLDDVASELDHKNKKLLFDHLFARQVFITTTDLRALPADVVKKAKILKIAGGGLEKN